MVVIEISSSVQGAGAGGSARTREKESAEKYCVMITVEVYSYCLTCTYVSNIRDVCLTRVFHAVFSPLLRGVRGALRRISVSHWLLNACGLIAIQKTLTCVLTWRHRMSGRRGCRSPRTRIFEPDVRGSGKQARLTLGFVVEFRARETLGKTGEAETSKPRSK